MLAEFHRLLTRAERRYFAWLARRSERGHRRTGAWLLGSSVLGATGVLGLIAMAGQINHLATVSSLAGILLAPFIFWESFKKRRELRSDCRALRALLVRDRAWVMQVTSSAVAAIEEEEWTDYLFQVEPGRLFYFDSGEFSRRELKRFPSTEFELVNHYADDAVSGRLRIRGRPLAPVLRLTLKRKETLIARGQLPEPDAIFPGNLADYAGLAAAAGNNESRAGQHPPK